MTDDQSQVRTALAGPGEIAESDAAGEIATAYDAIRGLLRVSHVPTIYRMLATHGDFLPAAVDAVGPVLDDLREQGVPAQLRESARLLLPDGNRLLVVGEARDDVQALLERYNLANPLNLLFTLLLVGDEEPEMTAIMSPPLPEPPVSPDVDAALDDIHACHGGFTVPGVWRELFRRPEIAHRAWTAIRGLGDAGVIEGATEGLLAAARPAAMRSSAGVRLMASRPAVARHEIRATLAWYPVAIATMVVEIEQLKRLLR